MNAGQFRSHCPDGEQVLGDGYTADVNVWNSPQDSLFDVGQWTRPPLATAVRDLVDGGLGSTEVATRTAVP